jgi:magnesium transporter
MVFEPQTAGRMMSLRILRVHEMATVAEAIAQLRAQEPGEEVFVLCAVDDDGRLSGVVPLRRLVFGDPRTPLRQVTSGRVISVRSETLQDEVARSVLRHRVWCIVVVDEQRRPMGMIRVRDLIQSLREGGATKESLRQRLTRLICPSPVTPRAPEVSYHLEASYVDMDAAYVRALLIRSLDLENIRLGSFESTKIRGNRGIRMRAELIAIAGNDCWIEQVAWRLSLEPGLKALSWQMAAHAEK